MKSRKTLLLMSGACAIALAAASFITQSPHAAEALNKEEVRTIVREYLNEHPEIVIEAIESYQANQEEIQARKFKDMISQNKNLLDGEGVPFAGNPDGDVTVVEFFDYNCGYCKRAIGDVQKVIEKDPNVKFVFREMPILSESSADAARYALAAQKQGKYFEYHTALMKFSGSKTEDTLQKIGTDLGLDVQKLREDANSAEIRKAVDASSALARDLGIRGTPAFIIGDTLVPGYVPADSMLETIEQARKDGKG